MESLTNPTWQVVAAVVVALIAVRLAVGRAKSVVAKQVGEVAESLAIAIFLVFVIIRPFVVQAYFIPSGSMRPTLIEGDRILVNKFVYRLREPHRGEVMVFKSPAEANKDEKDFIKRVIGLAGDEIRLRPGYVTVGNDRYNHGQLRALLAEYASGGLPEVKVKLTGSGVYVGDRKLTEREIATAAGQPEARVKVYPGVVLRNGEPLNEVYVAEDPDQTFPASSDDLCRVAPDRLFLMGDNRNESNDSRAWGLLDRSRVEGKAMFIFWPLNRVRWVR